MRIAFVGDSLTQGVPGSAYLSRLRRALPEHTLVNLGVGGDTVSSLLRRIKNLPQELHRYDLVFLWVGVNDIVRDTEGLLRLRADLAHQPPASSVPEFTERYTEILSVLQSWTNHVVAVPPLIKGEDPNEELNQRLATLASEIERIAATRDDVVYLDCRPELMDTLRMQPGPAYSGKPFRVVWDVLTGLSDAIIDRRASRRGFTYSIDGLHYNSRGADWVAAKFLTEIRRQLA